MVVMQAKKEKNKNTIFEDSGPFSSIFCAIIPWEFLMFLVRIYNQCQCLKSLQRLKTMKNENKGFKTKGKPS
jgi:hypothetical protein